MSEPKLKPCPFCGKIPTIEFYKNEWYGIACENEKCKIQPNTAWLKKRANVIREWNRRANDEQIH